MMPDVDLSKEQQKPAMDVPCSGVTDDHFCRNNSSSPVKNSQTEAKTGLSNFWRILSYSTRLDRCLMSAAALMSAGAGATVPLMNVIFGRLVRTFNVYFIPGSNMSKTEFLASVDQNALYIVYLFLAKFALGYLSIYAFRMTGIRISAAIRMAYLVALFNQPISAIDKLPPGAATDSLTTIANTIQLAVSDKLGMLFQSIALIIATYGVAFKYSWSLALVSSSLVLFVFIVSGTTAPFFFKYENLVMESNSRASGVAGEFLRAIRTVKSLCAEGEVVARYEKWTAQAKERGLKKSPWIATQYSPVYFSTYANMALTFWFGVQLYLQNDISDVGAIVTVLFSVLIVLDGVSRLFPPLQNISKAAAAAVTCFKIIDAPQLRQGGLKASEVQPASDIRFEHVRFAYPSRPQAEILHDVSFTIPTSKVTALVGHSGCGKSTIVALLERWYELSDVNEALPSEVDGKTDKPRPAKKGNGIRKSTKGEKTDDKIKTDDRIKTENKHEEHDLGGSTVIPNSGRISVGEHNIEDLDRKWWRSQIGLVQQEPVLFNETIYTNVARGLIGSQWEAEHATKKLALVVEACREAFADEFIQRLPDRYNTVVGDGGIKLSGGQRQRLAIARSIIKRPAVLIFDEATSSIDVRGERIVEAALERVSRNRTTIIIAHRLATIKRADNIIVLKQGTAVEEGPHDKLIAYDNGVYANLVRAQHLELVIADERDGKDLEQQRRPGDDETALRHAASKIDGHNGIASAAHELHGFLKSIGLVVYEQRRHRLHYCLILLGAFGGGTAVALHAYLFSHVIVVFQYTGARLVSGANFWSLMLFVLALGVAVSYAVIGYYPNSLSVKVGTTYRQSYFESILHKPLSWFDEEDQSSGPLTVRLSTDPQQLQHVFGAHMAFPLIAVFTFTGCAIISFVFGWKLTLVTFFAALPVICSAAFLRMRYETSFEALNAKVFAESSKFAAESIAAFRTVAALTLEDTIIQRYRDLLEGHAREAFMKGLFSVLVFALSDSLELCCMALAFWYGGQLLGKREYDVMQFFIIYVAVVQGGQAVGQFLAFGPNVAQATASANRILALRDGSEATASDTIALAQSGEGVEVEFRDASVTYPTRDSPVYKHLSFTIRRGDYVAFVGPSGCGKTTIISLLERFYAVSLGRILVDGIDINRVPLTAYRSLCALVSQEPTLFEGTVRENLVLGLPNEADQERVEEACRAAEIYDFITSLPQSFDTPLSAGTHASLSGGQKQRLCIARALLRKPRLLLLDEATSSLDSESEGLVQQAIERIAGSNKVTVVVVAHRLATVQHAGRIIVLGEEGNILEQGTHAELVQTRGAHWRMCRVQALGFTSAIRPNV